MAFTIGHARLELRGRRLANHRRRNGFVVRSSVSKVAYLPPETPPASVPLEKHLAQCESINEIWKGVLDEFGDSIALVDPLRGHEEGISFTQFEQLYKKCASTLRKLGMSKGQCMSVFSENSLNWLVLDQGLLRNGMINSVRGSAAPALELEFIFQDSESVALAVQDVKLLKKLESVLNPAEVKFVLILQGAKSAESAFDGSVPVYSFEEFIGLGEEDENHDTTVKKSDVATILYTSGTTGKPKGVPLTHGNILHQIVNVRLGEAHPRPEGVFVSILPCWHIFERTIEYISLAYGTRMVYSSIKSFRDDLAKYQPTHLVGVPRLFESLYGAVNSKFTSGSAFKKLLVQYLVQASESFAEARRHVQGRNQEPVDFSQKIVSLATLAALKPVYDIAQILVWGNVRGGIGGRVEAAVVGGGSLPMYLENFYDMAGIPVFVGYGLTETSPVIANRVPRHNVPGSCGLIPGLTDIKIVDPESREEMPDGHEGVLIVKGPTVFGGYLNRPDATEASFDRDGYFDTGDLAKKLAQGDIVLTGRQKDLIVLSNGENVAPQSIEDAITACPLIEQVVLCGQDERFLSALVVPELNNLEGAGAIDAETKQAAEQAFKSGNADDLAKAEEELLLKAKDALLHAIRERVQGLPDYQPLFRVMAVSLVLTPFSIENNLMTQTLKIRKQEVTKRYAEKIKHMYESH